MEDAAVYICLMCFALAAKVTSNEDQTISPQLSSLGPTSFPACPTAHAACMSAPPPSLLANVAWPNTCTSARHNQSCSGACSPGTTSNSSVLPRAICDKGTWKKDIGAPPCYRCEPRLGLFCAYVLSSGLS